ncbi:WD repeat and FYVE domain-containing protein 2 [Caerostris extrusa]|uniref:WD repeat and FYVE domain-containing protein 2 n=1 Tax=Caerostris extrusa TaxID=172846 RepID=A0AAV4XMY2_CAEEX|nr:WD repeat and FYVE domain-containing protein 2 [Caerostris extrusa]
MPLCGCFFVWFCSIGQSGTPEWADSDYCQSMYKAFFWNINRAMVDQKTIGIRQHHCRRCGKAVCDKCSGNQSKIPIMGYEFDVRVCDECHTVITDADKNAADCQIYTEFLNGEEDRSGHDSELIKIIKLWDVSSLLQPGADQA